MGEKSEQKKQLILETARGIFQEKGFKNVTMKDIVEACGISRGGLYLYFDSTKQLFEEVLKMEQQETDDTFQEALSEDNTIAEILFLFLKEQKKEILRKKENLAIATYEYFFEYKVPKKENLLRSRFEEAVAVLAELIEAGVETEEFYCEEPQVMARNIMLVLEGMKISARVMGISSEMVDRQLLYIMEGIVIDEDE